MGKQVQFGAHCVSCGNRGNGFNKGLCTLCASPDDIRTFCQKCKTLKIIREKDLAKDPYLANLGFPLKNGMTLVLDSCEYDEEIVGRAVLYQIKDG